MTYIEEKGNLFELSKKEYTFVHCIAADLKWGAGIAPILIKKEFDAEKLCRSVTDGGLVKELPAVGTAMYVTCEKGTFFNLITKQQTWGKPTYASMLASLEIMKFLCEKQGICKLAMPQIGCGLDRLDWEKVKVDIQDVFKDTDIDIRVRYI